MSEDIFEMIKKKKGKKVEEIPKQVEKSEETVSQTVMKEEIEPKAEPKPEPQKVEKPKEPEVKHIPIEKLPEEIANPTKEEKEESRIARLLAMKGEKFEDIEVVPEELPEKPKIILMVYGDKGSGKTYSSEMLPGRVVVISFDGKSSSVVRQLDKEPSDVIVFDGRKYFTYDYSEQTASGMKSYKYLKALAEYIEKLEPDWIVIDNTEMYQYILEQAMRYVYGLEPYSGVDWSLWKLRRAMMRDIHYLLFRIAKKGLVYTAYPELESIIEQGNIVNTTKKPKWIDIIMYETDVVIYTYASKDGKRFFAKVESTKYPQIIPVCEVDVTGKGLSAIYRG